MTAATAPLLQEPGGKPVLPDDLHLTLHFLGEVEEGRIAGLIRDITGHVSPPRIRLQLGQLDYWHRAQLVCLVPAQDQDFSTVADLAHRLRRVSAITPGAGDAKPFRPHVTVGRRMPAAAMTGRSWPLALRAPLNLSADGFALLRSVGEASVPRYAVEHAWRSGARPSV